MNSRVLLIVIAALLLVIAYLLYEKPAADPESTIRVGEPVITDTEAPPQEPEAKEEIGVDESETNEDGVRLSGTLVDFADGKDEFLGSFKYALIDDGTEIIRIDLRSIVGYDVTQLESDLGVTVGERVVIVGHLEDGEFVPTNIKAE